MDKRSYRTAGSQRLRTRPAPAHDDDLWRRHGAIAGRCATGRSYAPFRMPLCQALLRCWLTSRGCDNCAGAQAAAGRMQAGAHPTRAGSLRLLRADRGWGYTYAMHASSVRVTAIDSAACMPVGNLNFRDGAAEHLGAATAPLSLCTGVWRRQPESAGTHGQGARQEEAAGGRQRPAASGGAACPGRAKVHPAALHRNLGAEGGSVSARRVRAACPDCVALPGLCRAPVWHSPKNGNSQLHFAHATCGLALYSCSQGGGLRSLVG